MIDYQENKKIEKDQLEQLYASVGWVMYTNDLDRLDKAIGHSLSVIAAWHQENLVGLVRVVGDGYTLIYIQDLLVHPKYQNEGIGSTLLKQMLNKYHHVRQKVLLTDNAANVRNFYEKFGFTSCDKGSLIAFYKEF